MPATKYLILLETPSIKKYLFSTNTLAQIAGASALLDHLNREETASFLKKSLPDATIVYLNGGSGLFLSSSDRATIENVMDRLKALYHQETCGGATLLYTIEEYGSNDFRQTLRQAHRQLSRQKQRHRCVPAGRSPFSKDCQSCFQQAAEELLEEFGEKRWLCAVCSRKQNFYYKEGFVVRAKDNVWVPKIWQGFVEYVQKHYPEEFATFRWQSLQRGSVEEWNQGVFFSKDDEEVNQDSQRKGNRVNFPRMGLLYGDGNSMGRLVKALDSEAALQCFSEVVDSSLKEATYEALRKHCRIGQNLYARILLLGGDDLILLLPHTKVLPVAMEISEKFEEISAKKLKLYTEKDKKVAQFYSKERAIFKKIGFTLSFGVAIGKLNQNISILLQQAEALLKQAKARGSQHGGNPAPCYIDFQDTTELPFWSDIFSFREEAGFSSSARSFSRVQLSQRPYCREMLRKLLDCARRLKEEKWPNSKLHQIREICFHSSHSLRRKLVFLLSRVQKQQLRALLGALNELHPNHGNGKGEDHILEKLMQLSISEPKSSSNEGVLELPLLDLIEAVDLIENVPSL